MAGYMKTVTTVAPGHMELEERERPEASSGQALVRVEAVGLCGSDYHFYVGDSPYASYPMTQGHEFCGVIEHLPDGYTGSLRLGERVAIEPLIPCGSCYPCRNNRPNCCTNLKVLGAHAPGALSQYVAVNVERLYPVGSLDAELAALVEPMSIGVHGVVRGDVTERDMVVVFGAGPIGQAVTLAATDKGARVFAVDKIESRLELIQKLGAEKTLTSDQDVRQAVYDWTRGDGPSVVFDATGVPAVIRSAIDLVASSGRVVIIGITNQEVAIPVIEFTRKELTILGSRNNAGIFQNAVDLVQRNKERVRSLITHRFSFQDTPKAIDFAVNNPQLVEKVIVQF